MTIGDRVFWKEWINPREGEFCPWLSPEDNWLRINAGVVLSIHGTTALVRKEHRGYWGFGRSEDIFLPLGRLWAKADDIITQVTTVTPSPQS